MTSIIVTFTQCHTRFLNFFLLNIYLNYLQSSIKNCYKTAIHVKNASSKQSFIIFKS